MDNAKLKKSKNMTRKRNIIERGSPLEIKMRQSLAMAASAHAASEGNGVEHPLRRAYFLARGTVMKILNDRERPDYKGEEVCFFDGPDDWARHFAEIVDPMTLIHYVETFLREMGIESASDMEEGTLESRIVYRETTVIPAQMQIRMRAEGGPLLQELPKEILIKSERDFRIEIRNMLGGLPDFMQKEGRQLEAFENKVGIRLSFGSVLEFIAYYAQEYTLDSIIEVLVEHHMDHREDNVSRFVREKLELTAAVWQQLVARYRGLDGKRGELHEILFDVVADDIEEFCGKYIYNTTSMGGEKIKILFTDIASVGVKLVDDREKIGTPLKISYSVNFNRRYQGKMLRVAMNGAVFISNILRKLGIEEGEGAVELSSPLLWNPGVVYND